MTAATRASASAADKGRITDFFAKASDPASAPASDSSFPRAYPPARENLADACDPHVDSLPLFDPLDDDGDDVLLDEFDLTPRPSKKPALVMPVVSAKPSDRDSDKSPVPTRVGNPLVFDNAEDDLDLILNSSYDFLTNRKTKSDNLRASEVNNALNTDTRKNTGKGSVASLKRHSSLDLLDSIVKSALPKQRITASKYTYSLDSLLHDKERREKHLEETKQLEELLAREVSDENANPAVAAAKYLPHLLPDLDEPDYPADKSKRKKRKAPREDTSGTTTEDDEDVVYMEDEDDSAVSDSVRSHSAHEHSKKRVQSLLVDSLKTVAIESIIMCDDSQTFIRPSVILDSTCAEDSKSQIIYDSLKDDQNCEYFLISGSLIRAIQDSSWRCPEKLVMWLFETACYSDSELKASAAAKSLNKYFESASEKEKTWVITSSMFRDILKVYGIHPSLIESTNASVESFVRKVSNETASSSLLNHFPAFNFALCVELYTSCLINRSTQYRPRTLEDEFVFFTKLSMDQRIVETTGTLLATSVAKIARKLAPSAAESNAMVVSHIVARLGSFVEHAHPRWQHALVCGAQSALAGAMAAPAAALCPTRGGSALLSAVRRGVAMACVVAAGPGGGFALDAAAPRCLPPSPSAGDTDRDGADSRAAAAPASLAQLADIVAQYSVHPATTDYVRLAWRVRVLGAAVGGVSGILSEDDATVPARLLAALNRLHSRICDTSTLSMARTKVKEEIHDLKTWIELSLPQSKMQPTMTEFFEKA
ncbi:hypothetical protein HDU84_007719 [Entophlyctis sp. JEL0112]|nr:hypothetical protein HDU84_007719 [Entophlyctis sp. JEL0112]